ncbi:MAG: hypothetical protein JXN64_07115 [Spirochaetes bacterium]|nr:hypothetical protein [Spirochaetota bacterium]
MKEVKYLNEEDIIIKGVNVLLKELGPVETGRFLNIQRQKRLESIKRHKEWQKKLKKDEFLKEVFSS